MTQHTQKLKSRLIKGKLTIAKMVKEQKYITNESFPLCFFFLLLIRNKIAIKKHINQFIEFDLNTA